MSGAGPWPSLPRLRCLVCGFTWSGPDLRQLEAEAARHSARDSQCLVVLDD